MKIINPVDDNGTINPLIEKLAKDIRSGARPEIIISISFLEGYIDGLKAAREIYSE